MLYLQIIKIRHGIRFRPETDSSLGEGLLAQIGGGFMIEKHPHATSCRHQTERMPTPDIDDVIEIVERLPHTFGNSIDPNIPLHGIGPDEVVVSIICCAPDNHTAQICPPLHREKGDFRFQAVVTPNSVAAIRAPKRIVSLPLLLNNASIPVSWQRARHEVLWRPSRHYHQPRNA